MLSARLVQSLEAAFFWKVWLQIVFSTQIIVGTLASTKLVLYFTASNRYHGPFSVLISPHWSSLSFLSNISPHWSSNITIFPVRSWNGSCQNHLEWNWCQLDNPRQSETVINGWRQNWKCPLLTVFLPISRRVRIHETAHQSNSTLLPMW